MNSEVTREAEFQYLGDDLQSIGSEGSDPFGHLDYANTVVAEMDHFPPQFTLGLFGDWGSGKSTILEEIGKQLRGREEKRTAFVLFDAWRYEGDSLRREFIRSVGESLDDQSALREKFDLARHLEAFDSETTSVSGRGRRLHLGILGNGLLAALLVGALLGVLIFMLGKTGISSKSSERLLIALAGAVATFILFPLQRVVSPDPVQTTRRRLEFPDQFARNFSSLLDNVTCERLVIAIDNLDRCSPARVTEVLSSVKTFLEPAFKQPPPRKMGWLRRIAKYVRLEREEKRCLEKMCFIVAADDTALRRHLTSQELSRERLEGRSSDQALPAEVTAAVEEYLRKFFGASIRIRDLLDEDVRRFTSEQLATLVAAEEFEEGLADRVIEMTAQALKHNPRRIKQFVNNLRMRLQMLAQRRERERVLLEVNVLVVAKLAIIEEEFPAEYRQLQDDPGLLAKWHNQIRSPGARAEREGTEDPGDSRDPDIRTLPEGLRRFLRFTDDLQPRDIRAYLNLKQTQAEMLLPRHSEFIELLDGGEIERLGELLAAEEGDEVAYTEAARDHFEQERADGSWSRAHNTLRAIVEVPLLHGEGGKIVEAVLRNALREDGLRSRLGQLDSKTLMDTVVRHEFGAEISGEMIEQLIRTLEDAEQSEQRQQISVALATYAKKVDEENRIRLAEALLAERVRSDFDSYLPLAHVMPEVLRAEVLDAALARIEELGAEGVSMTSSAFGVALAALRSRRDDARLNRLLELSRPILAQKRDAGAEDVGAVAAALSEAVEAGGETGAMSEFAQWLTSDWGSFPSDQREGTWNLALALCRQSPEAAGAAGALLVDRLFELEEGTRVIDWLGQPSELPKQLRGHLVALLSEALAGEPRVLSEGQVAKLVESLSPEEQADVRRQAIPQALSREHPELARDQLAKLEEVDQQQVIEAIFARVREAPAQQHADARFLADVSSRIKAEQRFELAKLLAETIHADRGVVTALAPAIGTLHLPDAENRLTVVRQLITTELDMSDPENRVAMLRAIWSAAGTPNSNAKRVAQSRLEDVRKTGEQPMAGVAAELLSGRG